MKKSPLFQLTTLTLLAILAIFIISLKQQLAHPPRNLVSREIATGTTPGPTSVGGGINCIVGTATITPIATNNVIPPPIECSPSPTVTGTVTTTATTSPTSTGTVGSFTSPSPSPSTTPPPPDTRLEITLPIACGGPLGIVGSVIACKNANEIIAEPYGMIIFGEEFTNLVGNPLCRIPPGCLSHAIGNPFLPGHYHALVTLIRDETNPQTITKGETAFFVVTISGFSADSFGGSPSPTPSPSPSSTGGTGGGGTGGTGGGPSGWLNNFLFGHQRRVSLNR